MGGKKRQLSNTGSSKVGSAGGSPGMLGEPLPVQAWTRNPALRSWPVLLFVALVGVPPVGLVIVGPNPTMASFSDASWLFAVYFAVAWRPLTGVIVRPAQVTRQLLAIAGSFPARAKPCTPSPQESGSATRVWGS